EGNLNAGGIQVTRRFLNQPPAYYIRNGTQDEFRNRTLQSFRTTLNNPNLSGPVSLSLGSSEEAPVGGFSLLLQIGEENPASVLILTSQREMLRVSLNYGDLLVIVGPSSFYVPPGASLWYFWV